MQVLVIHGGDSFSNYEDYLSYLKTREITLSRLLPSREWKAGLQDALGPDFQVLIPQMPNKQNAPYDEAKNPKFAKHLFDFSPPKNLERFAKQGGKVFLYQSKDDPVVSFAEVGKYQKALPGAQSRIFEDRLHFNQETLPEIVTDIKSL